MGDRKVVGDVLAAEVEVVDDAGLVAGEDRETEQQSVLDAAEDACVAPPFEGLIVAQPNSRRFATVNASRRSTRHRQSALSATAVTTRWPRQRTGTSRPKSSADRHDPDPGRPSRTLNSRPSDGCTGTTPTQADQGARQLPCTGMFDGNVT